MFQPKTPKPVQFNEILFYASKWEIMASIHSLLGKCISEY